MRTTLCSSIAGLVLIAGPALADQCPQERAIYGDADGAYEMRFEPVGSQSAATSNHFKVHIVKSDTMLDGIVMASQEPVRPTGMVMYDCPEGDATGEEIAACTIWEGVIYTVDTAGKIGLLPAEGETAADQILLPALGPSIQQSVLWEKGLASVAPWDALAFKGCAE